MKKTNADDELKRFWRDNTNFAGLFNAHFKFRVELRPEDLYDLDSNLSAEVEEMGKELQYLGDVTKLWKTAGIEVILVLENQTEVDYGMPLRELKGRAVSADLQRTAITSRNKEQKLLAGKDYRSGLRKGDKIVPILPLTVYYGSEPWDGPQELAEMYATNLSELTVVYNANRTSLCSVFDSVLPGLPPG